MIFISLTICIYKCLCCTFLLFSCSLIYFKWLWNDEIIIIESRASQHSGWKVLINVLSIVNNSLSIAEIQPNRNRFRYNFRDFEEENRFKKFVFGACVWVCMLGRAFQCTHVVRRALNARKREINNGNCSFTSSLIQTHTHRVRWCRVYKLSMTTASFVSPFYLEYATPTITVV